MLERTNVVLVHRVRLEIAARAILELPLEPAPLLDWIVELAEGVGHFHARHVQLEALEEIGRASCRERVLTGV